MDINRFPKEINENQWTSSRNQCKSIHSQRKSMKINRFLKELNGVKVHGPMPNHPRLQAQPERVLKKKNRGFPGNPPK